MFLPYLTEHLGFDKIYLMPELTITSEYAYEVDVELKDIKKNLNYSFMGMGYYLHGIREKKLFELLDYESFNSYISQPELSIKRATAYKLIGIYETFSLKHGVSHERLLDIDYGKLDMIRTQVDEDNLEDMLQKAESLSRSDLQTEVTGIEVEYPKKYCPHCGLEVDHLVQREVGL